MNFLGKMFIILNFILAVGFVVISGTLFTQRVDDKDKLREEVDKRVKFISEMDKAVYRAPAKVESLKGEGDIADYIPLMEAIASDYTTRKEDFQRSKDKLSTQIEKEKEARATAENDLTEESSKRSAAEDLAREAENERKKSTAIIQSLQEQLQIKTNAADSAKEELADVKKEMESLYLKYLDSVTRSTQYETDAKALEADLDLLQKRFDRLQDLVNRIEKINPQIIINAQDNSAVANSGSRQIRGRVLAVRAALDYVIIDKGGPDGIKPGTQFIVYRDANYVGRIEVDKVIGEYSSAKITTKRLPFQQGDKIANRLEK
jgi:DNA repair exonuclease SbcCD ATPase subunit